MPVADEPIVAAQHFEIFFDLFILLFLFCLIGES